MTLRNLGVNYHHAGRLPEAVQLLEETYGISKNDPGFTGFIMPLFEAYLVSGKNREACNLVEELVVEIRTQFPKDSLPLAAQLASIGMKLVHAKAFTEAEPLLREWLAICEKTQPDAWPTFNTESLLGGALLGQTKYAEPLLVAGYEGMKQRQKTIPSQAQTRLPETLDRLIELYAATNRADEVRRWQAERANYPDIAPLPRQKK
jgi:tetratricopeptide (TPR) repeat protein